MPSLHSLLSFAAVAAVIIVVPGPSVLFVVGRALAFGRRAALVSVLGNATGMFLLASAVAVGIGAVVATSIAVFTVLKLAGAAYLVWLGIEAIRHRRAFTTGAEAAELPQSRTRFHQGLLVGATNPKGFALFAAVLPQFVEAGRGTVQLQMFLFGCVAVLIAIVTDSAWAAVAGTARQWFSRSARRGEVMAATGGAMMIGLGVELAVTGRRD